MPDARVGRPIVAWICVEDLSRALDAATYLEPTRHLLADGWDVTLIDAGDASGPRRIRGVPVVAVSRPSAYLVGHVAWHRAVVAELRLRGVEVVLFHPDSAPYVLSLRVRRETAWRPLLMMDTRTLSMTASGVRAWLRAGYYGLSHALANRWSDGQTAITIRMAEAVGIPSDQLLGVWPSGVDAASFSEARSSRCWPAGAEPLELIYVGALWRERRLTDLAEATRRVRREGQAVRLTLVGAGPQARELARVAERSNGAVRLLPAVRQAEVPALLAAAHLGVLPFPDAKMFRVSSPIKLFEYLAAGMPILATRIVCHTDVVGPDAPFVFWAEDASVSALTDAIARAVAGMNDLATLGRAAAAAAAEYDWQVVGRALGSAIERLWLTRRAAAGAA